MSNFSNTAKTMYLTASITNVATTATVTNTPGGSVVDPANYGWPTVPFYAEIDGDSNTVSEIVKVTNNSTGTLTIVRPAGQSWAYGSTPSAHNMNAPIVPVLAAEDIDSRATRSYVDSARMNLVINGNGEALDNTNFSGFTFDQSDLPNSLGSFSTSSYNDTKNIDTLIPVDVSKTYRFKYSVRQAGTAGAAMYGIVMSYDIDQNLIQPAHIMFQTGTHTTLAQDLDPGDTTVYLASSANWNNSAGANDHYRTIIVWGYANSKGYTYPDYTYSRRVVADAYADGGISGNNITLRNPWPSTWGTLPAGTKVSNGSSGGSYNYIAGANDVPTSTWQEFYGEIGKVDTTGTSQVFRFRPGTAYVKVGWLVNRNVGGSVMKFANISFTEVSSGQLRIFEKFDDATSSVDWFQVKESGTTPALSVDVENNRIGINKLSPTAALDVAGKILTTASSSGSAGFNLPHGTAPSSPVNGDAWTTSSGFFIRINGTTLNLGASLGTWGNITGTLSSQTDLQNALDAKQNLDADLTAIAALSGTSGWLKKTGANTWTLDTIAYMSSANISEGTDPGTAPNSSIFYDTDATDPPIVLTISQADANYANRLVTTVDNAIPRFDGTGGTLQNSGATVDDDGNIAVSSPSSGKVTIGTTSSGYNYGASVYLDVPTPAADHWAQVMYRVGGANRWKILRTMDAESGSDAGSNLEITSYSDSLTQNVRLRLNRATGKVTIGAAGSTAGLEFGSSGPRMMVGTGGPSGISAPVGSTWRQTDANSTYGSLTGLLWKKVASGTAEGTDWLVDFEGRWVNYTPTVSGWTRGNGTATGRYTRQGKTCHFYQGLLLSSTTIGGTLQMSLPTGVDAVVLSGSVTGRMSDAGTTWYQTLGFIETTNSRLYVMGTNGAVVGFSSTVPFTWVNGDSVNVHGWYEIA